MRSQRFYPLLALAIFIAIYLLPLGARPLFVPDETRYGEIAREMIASRDWVVPHLDGLRYFEKPVLGYWLHAGSLLLLGESNFAVRFPSALAVGLSGLLIFLLVRTGRKGDGEEEWQAPLAALAFLVCFEVAGVGTFAVLDSLLAFFLTGTMAFFYLATGCPPGSGKERCWLLAAGAFCGLAFLTKGFLALAVPVLALVPYLCWQRRYRDILRLSWLPLVTALAVALPWSLLIHSREPDYWHFFFWNEHVRRFLAHDAQHKESFWFYFLAAPAMFLPWTAVAPAAAAGVRETIRQGGRDADLTRYSLCWLLFPFLFFSASSGKLLTYILPCFPPFAILLTLGLGPFFRRGGSKGFQMGTAGLTLLFGLLLATLLLFQFLGYYGGRPYVSTWPGLAGAGGMVALFAFTLLAVRLKEPGPKTICLALGPALLFFLLPFGVPGRVLEAKAPGPLLEHHRVEVTPETLILSGEEPVLAACWTFHRNDVYLLGAAGELEYGLQSPEARGRLLDLAAASQLINRNRGRVVLVARSRDYQQWKGSLPPPASEDGSGPQGFVFIKY